MFPLLQRCNFCHTLYRMKDTLSIQGSQIFVCHECPEHLTLSSDHVTAISFLTLPYSCCVWWCCFGKDGVVMFWYEHHLPAKLAIVFLALVMAFLCLVTCTLLLEKWSCSSCTMKVIRDITIPNSFLESFFSPFSPLYCNVIRQLNTNPSVSVPTCELFKCCVNSSDTRKSKTSEGFYVYHKYCCPYFWRWKILTSLSFICMREKISQILLLETKSQWKDLSCWPHFPPSSF